MCGCFFKCSLIKALFGDFCSEYEYLWSSLPAEDAKKMAVKEEKYDPGYEAAYGGAYCDRALYESEPCNFSSNGTGKCGAGGIRSANHCL